MILSHQLLSFVHLRPLRHHALLQIPHLPIRLVRANPCPLFILIPYPFKHVLVFKNHFALTWFLVGMPMAVVDVTVGVEHFALVLFVAVVWVVGAEVGVTVGVGVFPWDYYSILIKSSLMYHLCSFGEFSLVHPLGIPPFSFVNIAVWINHHSFIATG